MGMPPTIEVASFGVENSLILMVLALVVLGPRRLPEIGRQIGRLMYEVRKASNDFKFQMEEELRTAEDADRRKKEEERQKALGLPAPSAIPAIIDPYSPIPESNSESNDSGLRKDTAFQPPSSPYPDEITYTSVVATDPVSPGVQPPLSLQPPSTGEQIAAARPGTSTGPTENSDAPDAATEQAHHG
jgi:sec-independent protein translocase protein TatB